MADEGEEADAARPPKKPAKAAKPKPAPAKTVVRRYYRFTPRVIKEGDGSPLPDKAIRSLGRLVLSLALGRMREEDELRARNGGVDPTWVATALPEFDVGDPGNEARLDTVVAVAERAIWASPGPGVVLFPAGWLSSGREEPRTLYAHIEARLRPALAASAGEVVVCLGVDGRDERDQVALAVGPSGIVAVGRKFHPTREERALPMTLAGDFRAGEDGHPRVFAVGGRRFYPAVCHDIFGISRERLANPGVDAVLGLAHGFRPGSGGKLTVADYARKGLAGASRQWECPVYASAAFFGCGVPGRWRSGVLWDGGGEGGGAGRYAVEPDSDVQVEEGEAWLVLRTFYLLGQGVKR